MTVARKPKLLFVTGGIHFPPTSGFSRRVMGLLKGYLSAFDVALISGSANVSDEQEFADWLSENTIDHVILKESPDNANRRIMRYLLPHLPIAPAELPTARYRRAIKDAYAKHEYFDVVHVERLPLIESVLPLLRRRSESSVMILDLDDWESKARLRLQAAMPESSVFRRLKRSLEPWRLRWYEQRHLRRFDGVLVCSATDRSELSQKLRIQNVLVVPNGYDRNPAVEVRRAGSAPTIGFIGTLDYHPNFAAVEFFIREVFPTIRDAVPDVRFKVAGGGSSANLTLLDQSGAVDFEGYVDSLEQFYAGLDVVVAPILSGGGTRVKILEAAAFRRPVVATTVGAEGIDFVDGSEILLRDSAPEIAQSCLDLLGRPELRESIAAAANEKLVSAYLWDEIGERLAREVSSMEKSRT